MTSDFTVVLRGYDRDQVDRLLAETDAAVASSDEAPRASARELLLSANLVVVFRGYARDQVDDAIRDRLRELGSLTLGAPPRAIELVVGIPEPLPVDRGGRDLDNYLYPLARSLGAHRIAAMFGRKVRQQGSTIAVDNAAFAEDSGTPALLTVRTSVSAQSVAWKQVIHRACINAVTEPLSPGPVALQLVFGVSSHRNWAALWKPAIDALGPVLGMPNPARPY